MLKKSLALFLFFPFFVSAANNEVSSAGSGSLSQSVSSSVREGSQAKAFVKLVASLTKHFIDGLDWHFEVGFGFKDGKLERKNISPAWLSWYAILGKKLFHYGALKSSKAPGVVIDEIQRLPLLEDAYNNERIAQMQEKFRAILREMNHPLAGHLRIFVGLFASPNAFTTPQTGVIACDRELWESDPEHAEMTMLHELGHIVNPLHTRWEGESRGLFPAFVIGLSGFLALQLMHHRSIRGIANHPVASLFGPALEKLESVFIQKAMYRYYDELYADTFGAEHIEDPRMLQKRIDYLESVEEFYRPFYYRIPFVDYILKRFVYGYPSRAARKANIEKIMKRRLAEEVIS